MKKISLQSLKRFRLKWLGGTWHILGFTLLPLLAAIAIVLYILNIETTFQPPLLFPVLSTIFSTGSGLIIAFFAIRTYISTSTWRVLFLGGGALAFGISSLVAGWLLPAGLNVAVTVSNFGVLLGATLHFLGAIQKPASDLASNPTRKLSNRTITILFCSALSAFFILVYVATSAGLFPAFFVPGLGYTLIRYIFSAIYLVLIVISAVVYARLYVLFKTKFIYWYSLGLAIFALGLLAGFLGIPGSPLNWVGRIAQYIGSVYFVVAVVITQNEARNKQMGVSELIAQHLNRSKANYELLVEAASDAIIAVDGLGRILMWNPAAEFMFGYDRNEAIGKPLFDLISNPEQVDAYRRAADKASPGKDDLGTTPVIELKARRRNGEEFPVELTLASRKRMAGWLPTTTLIIRDITERKRAEEALKESEQRYATTLASIGDAVISTDVEGRITFMNAVAEELTGWTLAEASTKPVKEVFNIINEYTCAEVEDPVSRVLQEGTIIGLANHTILVRKNGTEVPIDDSGAPIRDGDGRTMGVVLVFRDITERKQAEEALRSAEAKFRILVEQSLVGTYITQDKKIIYVNPKLAEILGYTQDEIISSKSVSDLIVEEDSDRAIENIRKRLRGEMQSIQHTFRGKRKDGILIDLEVHGTRTELDGKTVVIGTALDITERKQTEEALCKAHDELELRVQERTAELKEANKALLESEASYRELTESIDDLFFAMDRELRYTYWNKASETLTGISAKDAIGKSLFELFPEIKGTRAEQFYTQELKTQRPERFESQYQLGDKKLIFEVNAYPTKDGLSVIAKDITEKKMFEAHLLRAQRMESIGTLAGGIAHDLNNMLTPIMMSLQMFKEKYKDEQSQKLLTILENNSQRSADLIKQVLSFARGIEGERKPLQAKHIIIEIEKISKETFPRNIEIKTDIQKDLWMISGDATQLHQVIMNLCVNARDAMLDGGILNITASNFFIDENYSRMDTEAKIGSYIIIEVSDNGTGIPHKILDRIFEPFFTTKEFGKGTGLGLSTVLAIVKSHGGFINVDSEVGKGTTFGVYLPAIKTEMQSIDEKQPELLIGHGEFVLVAEDEDSVREVTISTLEKNGYRVLTASDGVEAISAYAQNMDEIKVILMDMMMPVMDGHASIRAIRRINPEVKIISVSGLAEKDKLKNVAEYTNAFLPKPYTAEKLLKIIHEVLNAK